MRNNRNPRLSTAIKLALGTSLVAMMVVGPAATAAEEGAAALERVQVTGSRISRNQLEGAQPILTITRDDIERTGLVSIGDLLQEIPEAGSAINTNFNNGGNGGIYINLRHLGSSRVLVLVNGKRWVNSTSTSGVPSSVDLQTIPISIIERIEVLKDGASAIYGSDAIAGVVNIITRDNFEGAEANAYYGVTDDGDGEQQFFDVNIGASSGRGSVFMSMAYVKQEAIHAGDRAISAEPVFGTGNALGSTTTPMGRFRLPGIGGIFGDATRDSVSGNPQLSDFRAFDSLNDPYNYAPDNYLATPSERYNIYVQGRYDLTNDIQFKTDILYNRRKSEQLLAAMPVTIGNVAGSATANGERIGVGANNPYNPFGVALDPDPVNGNMTAIQRRIVETGGRSFNQDVNTYRVSMAIEGSSNWLNRIFDWDVTSIFADNQTRNMTTGLFDTTRIAYALSDDCVTDPNCVPLNFFGGAGSISPRMLDYISFEAHDNGGQEMRSLAGNVTTELFELPAGPVGVAFGFEHRREKGFDAPDALINAGNTTGNRRTSTAGGFKVREFYGEIAVPVLADRMFAKNLEFQAAARYSDYDTFGDTTTGKLGLRWEVNDNFLIRSTYSEGFRAPSIAELYRGRSDSYPSLVDPCSDLANQSNQTIVNNCTSAGGPAGVGLNGGIATVPGDGSYIQNNTQIRITVGSNPNLLPEESESWTLGFVYSPSFVDGLSLAVDWYRIDLDSAIATLGATYIMDGCYAGGNAALCQLISREVNGEVKDLLNAGLNIGSTRVEGVDFNLAWNIGEISFLPGVWTLNWDNSYLTEYTEIVPGATPADEDSIDRYAGQFFDDTAYPRWKSNLGARWSLNNWEVAWRMRYIHRQLEDCHPFFTQAFGYCTDPSNAKNSIGSTTYHNVQASYHIPSWMTRVTMGINNIGDKTPPVSYSAFANSFDPSTYEVPGRFFYMRLTKEF